MQAGWLCLLFHAFRFAGDTRFRNSARVPSEIVMHMRAPGRLHVQFAAPWHVWGQGSACTRYPSHITAWGPLVLVVFVDLLCAAADNVLSHLSRQKIEAQGVALALDVYFRICGTCTQARREDARIAVLSNCAQSVNYARAIPISGCTCRLGPC